MERYFELSDWMRGGCESLQQDNKLRNMYFRVIHLQGQPAETGTLKLFRRRYFNSVTSFSLTLLISSIFLISPSVSF